MSTIERFYAWLDQNGIPLSLHRSIVDAPCRPWSAYLCGITDSFWGWGNTADEAILEVIKQTAGKAITKETRPVVEPEKIRVPIFALADEAANA